ncbi:MAG: hypothetical protein MK171_03315 [Pirellulales bacterium]|nr:hypothetical protein [Pirellulales bacterium]
MPFYSVMQRSRCALEARLLRAALSFWLFWAYLLFAPGLQEANADPLYGSFIGYDHLKTILGGSTPDGSGINVQHVEVLKNNLYYVPNPVLYNGTHTNVTLNAGVTQGNSGISTHANGTGKDFYGNNSIASGVSAIDGYEVFHWLGYDVVHQGDGQFSQTPDASGFLNVLQGAGALPDTSSARVANHSWVANFSSTTIHAELLRRLDYVVESDDFLQIVGIPNSPTTARAILASGYNDIAVGRTIANHAELTAGVDSVYTAGRESPSLVAPGATTSRATAMVSSAATVLMETAQEGSLSNFNQITNRTRTIYHAETSEVMRAALMAGADRAVNFTDPNAQLTGYAIDTSNNLDSNYGAGQVSVLHSYNILAGGEHDSTEDGGSGDIGFYGFDYDPSFGGSGGSNSTGTYGFTAGVDQILKASLVWNLDIVDVTFTGATTLHNLDLELWDATSNQKIVGLGATSDSTTESTENIFYDGLVAGTDYEMRVVGAGEFQWDYGIAWHVVPTMAPDLTLDGRVDSVDLGVMLENWQLYSLPSDGELDGAPAVDAIDLGILLAAWSPPLEEGLAAVPEPSSDGIVLIATLFLAMNRRLYA